MEKITLGDRIRNGWNAFINRIPKMDFYHQQSYASRPDAPRLKRQNSKSMISPILTRIAIDCAQTELKHVRIDADTKKYSDDIDSTLNDCFNWEANIDQSGSDFKLDIFLSLLDEGCIAIVPVDTDRDPYDGSFDILSMRTAKVLEWFPKAVRVQLYNERNGNKEELTLPKSQVAIIQNPLYSILNEPNSTLQRLVRKLALLDSVDEKSSSGKLDLIVQLPYLIRGEARKKQAKERRQDIEDQLTNGKYGIAYTDATEKVIQLNRPVENQLMSQVEYLTNLLFSQLGITQTILDGTADEQTLLNYYQRTINPIIEAVTAELNRKFISKTARTQGQAIMAFRDPFKLVPVNNIAEIADKFTRNEILSSNEIRQIIGMKPSDDPKADELINSNLNHNENEMPAGEEEYEQSIDENKEEY
jgi:hypothetical protein